VRDTRLALLIGGVAWLMCIGAYASALVLKSRSDATTVLLYNGPIAFVFLVLVAHLAVQAYRLGFTAFARTSQWTLLIWFVGFVVLYLRLVAKSLEVSGHLAWLPLLTAQSVLSGFPPWFSMVAGLATVGALYMKVALFRGPSGVPGAVVGLVLALALVLVSRRQGSGASVP
jgi:hypothetical protein